MFGFVGYIVHANGCTPARGTLTLAPPPRALILTPPPWPSPSPYPLPPARIHWPWKGPWESIPTDVSPQEAWDLTPEVRGGVGAGAGVGEGPPPASRCLHSLTLSGWSYRRPVSLTLDGYSRRGDSHPKPNKPKPNPTFTP